MKNFISILLLIFSLMTIQYQASAQGCVAVRNMASCSILGDSATAKGWQLSLNYRYFKSYKHFRGDHEEKERVENGTQVINHDNSVLLGVLYNFNNRWSAAATIPYLFIDRSSLYEHKGNNSGERYHTASKGLGDVRITGYFNTLPNSHSTYLNIGLGIKLPTGNYNYKDYFHKRGSEGQDTLVLLAVDQSIQPGDGGTGFILEFDFAQQVARNLQAYATGTYLFNPRNTNGTMRNANLVNNIPLSNQMSVADQFLLRAGGRYIVRNLQFALGGRYEGIPVKDAIGKSDGFRRPGYIVSVEPSVTYVSGRHIFSLIVPVALERNRTQSVLDQRRTEVLGTYQHGDAAFADYLVSLSYSCRFHN
jgi:hypothetical protein